MNIDLTGRVAWVGGASQGIGEACAKQLAAQGCNVIAVSRTEDKLKKVIDKLKQETQGDHSYLAVDIHDRETLKQSVGEMIEHYGHIDILLLNSGGPKAGAISQATEAVFQEGFEHHILSARLLTEMILPGMKKVQYGRILSILSTSVKVPIPNLGVSNTIRWAMAAWAKSLAAEISCFGITVNNVLPGFTDTPRLRELAEFAAKKEGISVDDIYERWLKTIPANRLGKTEDLANLVGFLASPAGAYINGTAIPVDGGRLPCI